MVLPFPSWKLYKALTRVRVMGSPTDGYKVHHHTTMVCGGNGLVMMVHFIYDMTHHLKNRFPLLSHRSRWPASLSTIHAVGPCHSADVLLPNFSHPLLFSLFIVAHPCEYSYTHLLRRARELTLESSELILNYPPGIHSGISQVNS